MKVRRGGRQIYSPVGQLRTSEQRKERGSLLEALQLLVFLPTEGDARTAAVGDPGARPAPRTLHAAQRPRPANLPQLPQLRGQILRRKKGQQGNGFCTHDFIEIDSRMSGMNTRRMRKTECRLFEVSVCV